MMNELVIGRKYVHSDTRDMGITYTPLFKDDKGVLIEQNWPKDEGRRCWFDAESIHLWKFKECVPSKVKKTAWVNVYKGKITQLGSNMYKTREQAEKGRQAHRDGIDTVKIEWEEDE